VEHVTVLQRQVVCSDAGYSSNSISTLGMTSIKSNLHKGQYSGSGSIPSVHSQG